MTRSVVLPKFKKVLIGFSQKTLDDIDQMARDEEKNRSEFVRDALRFYINRRKKQMLKDGVVFIKDSNPVMGI